MDGGGWVRVRTGDVGLKRGNMGEIVIGRMLIGMSIGMSAVVVPMYVAEMSSNVDRGKNVATYELLLATGTCLRRRRRRFAASAVAENDARGDSFRSRVVYFIHVFVDRKSEVFTRTR